MSGWQTVLLVASTFLAVATLAYVAFVWSPPELDDNYHDTDGMGTL